MSTVLVIEDDPSYRNVMEVILQMEGFQVHAAPSGPAGLALLSKMIPDVILCDIMMPEMDGHGVLEALKQEKRLAEIPFIFVTALADRFDLRRGMAAGADDYLTKPFTADELSAAVLGRIRRARALTRPQEDPGLREKQNILRQKVTRREREVLLLVGQGATSKQIAEHLKVSLKTVEVHRSNLMRKLDVANAASLSRWALIAESLQQFPDPPLQETPGVPASAPVYGSFPGRTSAAAGSAVVARDGNLLAVTASASLP